MDEKTAELYKRLKDAKGTRPLTYWPELKVELVKDGPVFEFFYNDDCLRTYFAYKRQNSHEYAEWYRCLAYVLYGYGNWSNNDRLRRGLPPIRKRRR